jgi:hypothetical protein
LEGLGVDGKPTVKQMLQKEFVGIRAEFVWLVWLRVGTSDKFL